MDVIATALIWVSVGTALVLLVHEQSRKVADFARAQASARAAVAEEILDVCGDEASVAFYHRVSGAVPDNLVYYALAETRQKLACGEVEDGAGPYFTRAITRLAAQNGCSLEAEAA